MSKPMRERAPNCAIINPNKVREDSKYPLTNNHLSDLAQSLRLKIWNTATHLHRRRLPTASKISYPLTNLHIEKS